MKFRGYDAVRIFDMYRKSENDVFKSMAELGKTQEANHNEWLNKQ